jgi:hypothetical protein
VAGDLLAAPAQERKITAKKLSQDPTCSGTSQTIKGKGPGFPRGRIYGLVVRQRRSARSCAGQAS